MPQKIQCTKEITPQINRPPKFSLYRWNRSICLHATAGLSLCKPCPSEGQGSAGSWTVDFLSSVPWKSLSLTAAMLRGSLDAVNSILRAENEVQPDACRAVQPYAVLRRGVAAACPQASPFLGRCISLQSYCYISYRLCFLCSKYCNSIGHKPLPVCSPKAEGISIAIAITFDFWGTKVSFWVSAARAACASFFSPNIYLLLRSPLFLGPFQEPRTSIAGDTEPRCTAAAMWAAALRPWALRKQQSDLTCSLASRG